MKFVIVESFNHPIPTGLGFIEGLTQLGHEVYGLPTTHYSINDLIDYTDCLIILGWPNTQNIIQFKNKFPETKIIVVGFGWNDVVLELKDYVNIWMEHTYKHDLADEIYKQHGLILHHIPLGASLKFKPLGIEYQYDLSFIGKFGQQGHGYRYEDKYLYPLMGKGLKGFYSGFNGYPTIPHDALNEIYNSTKININFHYWYQKCQINDPQTTIDFNGRVFEIALAGGFQLCDHPYMEEYFGEGIITSSKEKWEETFNFYLNNDEIRREISIKAHQNALQNHTWKNRMQQLINIL